MSTLHPKGYVHDITSLFVDIMRSAKGSLLISLPRQPGRAYHADIHISVQIYAIIIDRSFKVTMPFFRISVISSEVVRNTAKMDSFMFQSVFFPLCQIRVDFFSGITQFRLLSFFPFSLWSIIINSNTPITFDELMYYALYKQLYMHTNTIYNIFRKMREKQFGKFHKLY